MTAKNHKPSANALFQALAYRQHDSNTNKELHPSNPRLGASYVDSGISGHSNVGSAGEG